MPKVIDAQNLKFVTAEENNNEYLFLDILGTVLYENNDTANNYLVYVLEENDTIKSYVNDSSRFFVHLELGKKYVVGFKKEGFLPKHLNVDVVDCGHYEDHKYGFEFPMQLKLVKDSLNSPSEKVADLRYYKETGYIDYYLDSTLIMFKRDFDESDVGYDTPEALVRELVSVFQNYNDSDYLKFVIPLDVKLYLLERGVYDWEVVTEETYMDSITENNSKRVANYIERVGFLFDIIKNDKKVDFSKTKIVDIEYEKLDEYHFGYSPVKYIAPFAMANVKMVYKNDDYFLEIPQIVQLKGKWFLNCPEYYFRDKQEAEFLKTLKE